MFVVRMKKGCTITGSTGLAFLILVHFNAGIAVLYLHGPEAASKRRGGWDGRLAVWFAACHAEQGLFVHVL